MSWVVSSLREQKICSRRSGLRCCSHMKFHSRAERVAQCWVMGQDRQTDAQKGGRSTFLPLLDWDWQPWGGAAAEWLGSCDRHGQGFLTPSWGGALRFHTVSKDVLGLIVSGSLCGQQETGVKLPFLFQVTPSTPHVHGFTFWSTWVRWLVLYLYGFSYSGL